MTDLQKAIEEIRKQIEKLDPRKKVWCVGMQLIDILNETPTAAAIVLEDFKNPGMKVEDCEKKIEAFAKENRDGNVGFCPPLEADRIIREFYGIPARVVIGIDLANGPDFTAMVKPAQKPKKINLAKYL